MDTLVVFGLKYKVERKLQTETGFWLWKRKQEVTNETIKVTSFFKKQEIPASITQVDLPVFGPSKIRERVARSSHVEIWMGNFGFWPDPDIMDMEFITEARFNEYKQTILSQGYLPL